MVSGAGGGRAFVRFRELVAKNVRRLRRRHGWTQRQLAERLQCHKQTVWAIEAGRQGISDRLMDDLARTFDVDYYELVRREDETHSHEHSGTARREDATASAQERKAGLPGGGLRKEQAAVPEAPAASPSPSLPWPMTPEDVHSLIRRVAYEAVRELMREYQVRPPEASADTPPDRTD